MPIDMPDISDKISAILDSPDKISTIHNSPDNIYTALNSPDKIYSILKNSKGFTLFETLIVASIVGILAVIIIPNIDRFRERKEENGNYQESINIQKNVYELIRKDLNGNGLPEVYFEVDGKKFFYEIDGQPVIDYLQR